MNVLAAAALIGLTPAAMVVRGGVERVAPGQASLLLGLPDREPPVVRLADTPPPPPPPMPISHHDRPATPAIGTYHVGRLGAGCGGGTLADGRPFRDQLHRFEAGARNGISLTSPDAPLTLQVFRAGAPEQPLATLEASGDGRRATGAFAAAEGGDHVLRIIGARGSDNARWRVELSFDRSIDSVYFSDWFDWNAADRACG